MPSPSISLESDGRQSQRTQTMKHRALLFFALVASSVLSEDAGKAADAFRQELAQKVAAAEKQEKMVLRGRSGWFFFVPELRSISVGKFWGEDAAKVSRASRPDWADPLPAILDFHSQLKGAGIELLLVPVPPKAIIYPDMISKAGQPIDKAGTIPRLDRYHQQFYRLLQDKGMKVLDLVPMMMKIRGGNEGHAHCKTDTHWSSTSCKRTARLIAESITDRPWLKKVKKRKYTMWSQTAKITGDLSSLPGDAAEAGESFPMFTVSEEGKEGAPIEPWRESPVLLLGDSHTLVFHAGGDLHAQGAGLADHLAKELGFPVDLLGVRGSGSTTTRISLLRRRDNLAGKKLVIWCFTAREFTESFQGWRKLQVIKPE